MFMFGHCQVPCPYGVQIGPDMALVWPCTVYSGLRGRIRGLRGRIINYIPIIPSLSRTLWPGPGARSSSRRTPPPARRRDRPRPTPRTAPRAGEWYW